MFRIFSYISVILMHDTVLLDASQVFCSLRDSEGSYECRIFGMIIRNESSVLELNADSVDANVSLISKIGIYESFVYHVPSELFQVIPNIENLSLRGISLSEIDKSSFKYATKLKSFRADLNFLIKLRMFTFSNANNLETIYLRGNLIESVDEKAFSGLHKLQILSLSQNSIKSLAQNTFADCHKLKILFLNNNQLKSFNFDLFNKNPFLEWLFLEQNKIESFYGKTATISYLKVINLLDNICVSNYFQSELGVGNDVEASLKNCFIPKQHHCEVAKAKKQADCEKQMEINLKLIENFERNADIVTNDTEFENQAIAVCSNTTLSDNTEYENLNSKLDVCKRDLIKSKRQLETQRSNCRQRLNRQSILRQILQRQLRRLSSQLTECEDDSGFFGFLFGL